MFTGRLVAICIAPARTGKLTCREEIEAVPGRGLAGDRYFLREGTYSKPGAAADREVTLIEIEAIEALQRDCQITLQPEDARRNLVTQGVPLNHLVGRDFTVGQVRLHGIRLCEPCGHLEKLTVVGVEIALKHRGGLRAQVVQGGLLRVGDPIQMAEAGRPAG
jgi:MOSC domain-containing protein YiiM